MKKCKEILWSQLNKVIIELGVFQEKKLKNWWFPLSVMEQKSNKEENTSNPVDQIKLTNM